MPVVTNEMIADLPSPVLRSLRRSGIIGREIPAAVTVLQEGQIRSGPDRRWLRFTAQEEYTVDTPGFVWSAALKIGGLTAGRATDSLDDGRGRMHVRLVGLFTVVDEAGPEMDQGALMRWLNETMWFPSVWATDVVSWESIDEHSAIGSVSFGGLSARAEFRFDHDGRLVDFRADRNRDVGSGFEMTPWSTPLTEHDRFDGIELPSYGSAVWILDDGDLEYIRVRVTDVRYAN
jgi:hypothetical protein